MYRQLRPFLCLIMPVALLSCIPEVPQVTPASPASHCSSNNAMILVGDGFLQGLCGCAEGSITANNGGSFNCTVLAGTTVYFDFHGAELYHQILSVGSPTFVSSPVVKPSTTINAPVEFTHVVSFPDTGTYSFQDSFNLSITSQIIVQ